MRDDKSRGTTFGMLKWYSRMPKCRICRKKYLVETYARERGYCAGCFRRAVLIETGEWHCAGNFIQENEHPELMGRYEVFRDDECQTHIGRYCTFNEAKRESRNNSTKHPINGGVTRFV